MLNLDPQDYHSFLLRLWQVKDATGLAWRASLEHVETGSLRGFASLEELVIFLRQFTSGSHDIEKDKKAT